MRNCAVVNCKNRQFQGCQQSFHHFPLSKPDLCKKWVDAMRRKEWTPKTRSLICSDHFTENCFDRTGQTIRIHESAIPSIFTFESCDALKDVSVDYPSFSYHIMPVCKYEDDTISDADDDIKTVANPTSQFNSEYVISDRTLSEPEEHPVQDILHSNRFMPEVLKLVTAKKYGNNSQPEKILVRDEKGKATVINVVIKRNQDSSTSNALSRCSRKEVKQLEGVKKNKQLKLKGVKKSKKIKLQSVQRVKRIMVDGNAQTDVDMKLMYHESQNKLLRDKIMVLKRKIKTENQRTRRLLRRLNTLKKKSQSSEKVDKIEVECGKTTGENVMCYDETIVGI